MKASRQTEPTDACQHRQKRDTQLTQLPRERVMAALEFRRPDKIPLQIHASPAGLYEHGQKLGDLTLACGHDFGDLSGLRLPEPPATDFDAAGNYHARRTDEWGVSWEHRLFGVWGHPFNLPLANLGKLSACSPPAPPPASGPDCEMARQLAARHSPASA